MARSVVTAAMLATAIYLGSAQDAPTANLSALHSRHGFSLEDYNLTDEFFTHAPQGWDDKAVAPASSSMHVDIHWDFKLLYACGVDVLGHDLLSQGSRTILDCNAFCDYFWAECEGTVWTSYNGGTCWYKRAMTRFDMLYDARPNADAVAAIFQSSSSSDMFSAGRSDGYDIPGHDLGHDHAASYNDCVTFCRWLTGCWAVTWTNYNGGTCWYKTQAAEMVKSPGATSTYLWKDWKSAGPCKGLILQPSQR